LAEVVCALTFLKLVNIQRGPLATSTWTTVTLKHVVFQMKYKMKLNINKAR